MRRLAASAYVNLSQMQKIENFISISICDAWFHWSRQPARPSVRNVTRWSAILNPTARFERIGFMTISLLHRLATEELPQTLNDANDIEAAHVLVLAGHVRATFYPCVRGRDGRCLHRTATVHALTSLGRRFVRAFPRTRHVDADKCGQPKGSS